MNDARPIDDMGRHMSPGLIEANKQIKPFRLQLLDAVTQCLSKSGVSYWVSDGTALGAFREKGMIAHDCDIDLTVRAQDLHRVSERWLPEYVSVRYVPDKKTVKSKSGLKIVFTHKDAPDFDYKDDLQDSGAELDLYTFHQRDDGAWIKNDERYNQVWRNEVLFPLAECEFEGRTLPCPNDLESYLLELYGYIGRDAVWNETTKRYVPRN